MTDLFKGRPSSILVSETTIGLAGKPRLFTQKIQVPDADLWARLTAEVKKGDTISVTVETVWPDEGRYYNLLVDFASQEVRPFTSSPAGLLEAIGNST